MLTSEDLKRYWANGDYGAATPRQNPRDALWKGIEDGTVDTLVQTMLPTLKDEKSASSVWDVKVGVPGLETTLPLILTQVKKNRLTLAQVVHLLAEKPAEIFGLSDRGRLEQGKNADLTVVDFNCQIQD